MPTDRGYAVISRNADGTAIVQIATAIDKGRPKGAFAVRVDPVTRLAGSGSHRYTTTVAEVSSSGGAAVTLLMPKNPLT
jgi:hypothetical protein